MDKEEIQDKTTSVEKKTLKESELNELITTKAQTVAEERMKELVEEQRKTLGDYAGDQLKEQIQDVLAKSNIKPDEKLEEADKKAKQFGSFSEFLGAVRNVSKFQKLDERLTYIDNTGKYIDVKTAGHMEEGTDSQGGFLVPEVYRADLRMIGLESAVVRPYATIIPPIKTDSVKIPYVNDTSHASNVFGGVSLTWTAEAGEKDATKPEFGQMELTPHKLAGVTHTSDELLKDSAIALEPLIKFMFGSAMNYFEDDAFLNGTGAGQPQGILNCNGLKKVTRNTLSHIYLEDLAEMYANMLPGSRDYGVWVVSPTAIPELIQMGTGNAAAASGKNLVYIDKVQDKLVWKIFGRPVIFSEKMPALGSEGDIGFFDLRYYIIFDRQPVTIDSSTHVAFTTDETAWRFVLRVDGQCWPASVITPRQSGAPVTSWSPFVILDNVTS